MNEIHENTGLWETTNQQNNQQNIPTQEEIANVLQSYMDNPTIVMALVNDSRTPSIIIQQIALNPENRDAQIAAVSRMTGDVQTAWPLDVYYQILRNLDLENESFRNNIPQICTIILQWTVSPWEVIEYIFTIIRDNRIRRMWLERCENVIEILTTIVDSENRNITEILRDEVRREIENVNHLLEQRREIERTNTRTLYVWWWNNSSGNDPVGRSNYRSANHHWHGKW